MEVTPDIGASSEGLSTAASRPSNAGNLESGRDWAMSSETEELFNMELPHALEFDSRKSDDATGTVKEGKKRAAHNDPLEESDAEDESEFSTNAHNGMPGVNGMAKAKPAAKKLKLEEPSNARNPPCWRCREADIPCLGNKTRSSCNACFHHHWKCATNPPSMKGKKPKNNTISANALKHLLWHPQTVGSNNTGSKVVGEKGNPTSYSTVSGKTSTVTNSASKSAPASSKDMVSVSAPTAKGKEKAKISELVQPSGPSMSCTSSGLPVLILAPPSVSAPTLRLGPPTPLPASISTESSMSASASASASSSRHNRNRTRRQESAGISKSSREKPVAPTFSDYAGEKVSDRILDWPGHTKTRSNPRRSARPARKEFDADTDEEEEEQGEGKRRHSAADKGKQKAHEPGDISELSSPPSSIGSTPDPSSSLFPTGALEPRPLPTTSTLPTVVTTLNALTSMVKTMRTDLGEVKDTTASLSGSKSTLDWGITLDKLNRQEKLINQQSKVLEAQGEMIRAMAKSMMELMGEKFVFDFDVDEGTGGGGRCSVKETPVFASQPVFITRTGDASEAVETALRPVGNDTSMNQASTPHTSGQDNGKAVEQADRPLVVDTATNRGSVYVPSKPIPVRKASSGSTPSSLTSTTTVITTQPHELPPPRATSFMRPQQKPAVPQEPRNQLSTPKPAVVGEPSVASSSLLLRPSSANEERPHFSTAHWSQTRVHDDSDEERDELLDDTPIKPSLKQGWVKTQMMALR